MTTPLRELLRLVVIAAFTMNVFAVPVRAELAIVDAYVGKIKAASIRKTPLTLQGQAALLIEKLNDKNQVLARLVSWTDKLIVEIDAEGDGHVDTWEMYSNDTHIKMSAPANDTFNVMDVDYLSSESRVTMRFSRQANGEFILRSQSQMPLVVEFEESVQGIAGGRGAVEEVTDAPLDVRKRVALHQEKMLTKSIKKVVNQSQCGGPAKRTAHLETAIARVALSGGTMEVPPERRYLSCLREHGLESEASFISSRFFSTMIPENSSPARWSVGCQTCQKEKASVKSSQGLCQTQNLSSGAFRARGAGGKPEITFIKNVPCRGSSCEPTSEQKSRTFFHEMLHAASVGSEQKVDAITKCCAPSDGKPGNCTLLDNDQQARERTQIYLSLYFNLKEATRKEVDGLCARLPANPATANQATSGADCPLGYISKLAEAHQKVLEQNKASSCKSEVSAACQTELTKAQSKVFAVEVSSRCDGVDKDNVKAKDDCRSAASGLAAILAPVNAIGDKIDFAKGGASVRHQLPTGQMADAAGKAGQAAAESSVPGTSPIKVYSLRGPQMANGGLDASRTASAERAQAIMADVLGKQVGLIDSVINRLNKIAHSVFGIGPAHANQGRSQVTVVDPSRTGMSAHMRKLLTSKSQASGDRGSSSTVPQPLVTQDLTPAQSAARETFVNQMTNVSSDDLHRRLDQKDVQKTLADHNIGVIDQKGARHDRTAEPTRWLIYDEDSGRLRYLDADEK